MSIQFIYTTSGVSIGTGTFTMSNEELIVERHTNSQTKGDCFAIEVDDRECSSISSSSPDCFLIEGDGDRSNGNGGGDGGADSSTVIYLRKFGITKIYTLCINRDTLYMTYGVYIQGSMVSKLGYFILSIDESTGIKHLRPYLVIDLYTATGFSHAENLLSMYSNDGFSSDLLLKNYGLFKFDGTFTYSPNINFAKRTKFIYNGSTLNPNTIYDINPVPCSLNYRTDDAIALSFDTNSADRTPKGDTSLPFQYFFWQIESEPRLSYGPDPLSSNDIIKAWVEDGVGIYLYGYIFPDNTVGVIIVYCQTGNTSCGVVEQRNPPYYNDINTGIMLEADEAMILRPQEGKTTIQISSIFVEGKYLYVYSDDNIVGSNGYWSRYEAVIATGRGRTTTNPDGIEVNVVWEYDKEIITLEGSVSSCVYEDELYTPVNQGIDGSSDTIPYIKIQNFA